MYIRARYYDPATGEFISRDPLEYVDGMSLYRGYFVPGGVDPLGLETRRQWKDDQERREALCDALKDSKHLQDFVNKYDPTWGGDNGYDLFNLTFDTERYGNVDVDWMITLLAAHYGRGPWVLTGSDPGTIYDIGKRWWIVQDWWTDSNVPLDFENRLNQANELAAVAAARDLLEGTVTLSDLFGIDPTTCGAPSGDECETAPTGDREVERGRNSRGRRNRRFRGTRGRRTPRAGDIPGAGRLPVSQPPSTPRRF